MSDHKTLGEPSLWRMEPHEVNVLLLSKVAEEANELAARCNRAIAQGLNGIDPDSGRTNYAELQDEVADVKGLSALLVYLLAMDAAYVQERADAKRIHKHKWLAAVAVAGPQS